MAINKEEYRVVGTAEGLRAWFRGDVKYGELRARQGDGRPEDEIAMRDWLFDDVVVLIENSDGVEVTVDDLEIYQVMELATLIMRGFTSKNSRRR